MFNNMINVDFIFYLIDFKNNNRAKSYQKLVLVFFKLIFDRKILITFQIFS